MCASSCAEDFDAALLSAGESGGQVLADRLFGFGEAGSDEKALW